MADRVRLRATATYVLEWDADPTDYVPDGRITPEEMAALDQHDAEHGEFLVFDHPEAESTVKVEIVQ